MKDMTFLSCDTSFEDQTLRHFFSYCGDDQSVNIY